MQIKITLRYYFSPQIGQNLNTSQHILLVKCGAEDIRSYNTCGNANGLTCMEGKLTLSVRITNVFTF